MTETKTRAVIYARVSTAEQNYSEQIHHLKGWAEARGYEVKEIYAKNKNRGQHECNCSL